MFNSYQQRTFGLQHTTIFSVYYRIQLQFRQTPEVEKIEHILYNDRWIVILGDPGSAKNTFLRWIMHTFSEEARQWFGNLNFGIYDIVQFRRIPIFIRISEFSKWLENYPTKTLIDYIGKHTCFSESYCDEDREIVLKELVHHGHALILIHGLDEISDRTGKLFDFKLVGQSIGNQIIATNRIVDYQLNSLSLMDNIEVKQFVCK